MNFTDFGRISLTVTPVASFGPLFLTVIVHSIVSPKLGEVLFTDFAICKSVAGLTTIDALPLLLDGF